MSNSGEKPKIIIDEDWKAQVQTEKEAADKLRDSPEASGASEAAAPDEADDGPIPPPTLSFLFTTLATQAMVAMGDIPNPITGKSDVRPQQAKHFIDTLGMLEAKTQNNRTPEESALLNNLLYQLRIEFVEMQKRSRPSS